MRICFNYAAFDVVFFILLILAKATATNNNCKRLQIYFELIVFRIFFALRQIYL